MKVQIKNYSFDASTGKITFSDYSDIVLEGVLYITHVTDSRAIYNPINKNLGGSVSGNVLTLDYDTSLMSDSDDLLIYYDDAQVQATNAKLDEIIEALGGPAASGEPDNLVVTIASQDVAQPLALNEPCRSFVMIAYSGNSEIVAYGGEDIDADSANQNADINGAYLFKGQGQAINNVDNLNKMYISGQTGDKILVTYYKTAT